MKTTKPLLLAAVAVMLSATAVQAQRAHLGFRAGYEFDRENALLGAQITLPLSGMVELYPSFDYYLTEGSGSMVGFNVDLKLRSVGQSALYVGGGLNMLRASSGGSADTDTGGNLFLGVESRTGAVHPFFELRGLLRDNSAVQIVGGLNFSLY
jgi:hypothetical protein